jgi:hypothetical protein
MASGISNIRMALIHEIRKCMVSGKEAGRGCGDMFFQFFADTLPSLFRDLANLRVKY